MTDENFLDNPFYIALTKQFPDLYAKAAARKCVVCVPIASSIHVSNRSKPRALIPKAELGLHILRPSPLQSLEQGLYDCVQSGYSVKIERPINGKKGVIRAYSGFGRNFTAEILSEEKCYDERSGGSFTLLMIDHPLGEGMDVYTKTVPTLDYSLANLSSASCDVFLRDVLTPVGAEYIIASFKRSIEQILSTYVLLEGYLDDLAKRIQSVVAKAIEESARAVPAISRRDATAAFEVFGHNLLYHMIFKFLHDREYRKEEAKVLLNMKKVGKPTKIDGLMIEKATFPLATATLMALPGQTSPLQQLVYMARGLHDIQEDLKEFQKEQIRQQRIQKSSIILSADDTLYLLIYILASNSIPHFVSSVAYVTLFCWTIPDASLQYALTTFEAAVKFLESFSAKHHSDEDDASRSLNASLNGYRDLNSPSEGRSWSSTSECAWDVPSRSSFASASSQSRPSSVSPSKAGALSQIDGKLKDLSLLMQESSAISSPGRHNIVFGSPPKVNSPPRPGTPQSRTSAPLDFFNGGLPFGQQK